MDAPTAARSKALFFTRGRGRGHALPDLAIAEALERMDAGIELRFVSYATGATTLREGGREVLDLDLPEDAPFLDVLTHALRAILREQPTHVVSHEEFSVLPAAKTFGLPTAFIVDFFSPPGPWTDSLRFADHILFIERQGIFPEPPQARGRIRYLGPVVRPMSVTRADQAACRARLALSPGATVIAVIPGAWASEQRAPLFGLVLAAFQALDVADKRLVWLAGRDVEQLSWLARPHQGVVVRERHDPVEELIAASDLVITKGNRGATVDAASLGVPSLSLSFGANPADEAIVPRISSNTALDARGVDASFLATVIETLVARGGLPPSAEYASGGAARVAQALAALLARPGR